MLKTLKPSEKDILFKQDFLLHYYKHIVNNPDSLLSKIFGVFEMQIKKNNSVTAMTFFITENMVRYDQHRVRRCFDLKGSLYGRETKISEEEKINGTGMKCLKDKNFIEMND